MPTTAPASNVKAQLTSLRKEATMIEETEEEQVSGFRDPESSNCPPQSYRSVAFVELRNTLPSYVGIISPIVDQLKRFISRFRRADENNLEIELALREALLNAVVHGNREDPTKRVYVNCRCTTDGEVSIRIEDEGLGFKHDAVAGPTSPQLIRSGLRAPGLT